MLMVMAVIAAMGGACTLEGGGFSTIVPLPDPQDSATEDVAETGPPEPDAFTPTDDANADSGDACPDGSYRCGSICVSDCYKDCAQKIVCESTKKCVASCESCGTAKKACYKCPDGVAPFASCEAPKGECYAGVYVACSCSTSPPGPLGDPSKCPGDDMVCLHLNGQDFVCKNCGDRETADKACGKGTPSRECEIEDDTPSCH